MENANPENESNPAKKDKFDPKKPPNKDDPEEVYQYVAKRISGPSFRNPLKNFIDENCLTFIDVDENTFEQGQLFKELNQLLENLLNDVLQEGQISQEDFLKAAERGVDDKQYKKYFNQVINFGDYNFFKSIMTKRNYQMIKMAEQQMNNMQQMAEEQLKEQGDIRDDNDEKTKELVMQLIENEKKELDEAIKQSLAEEDKRRRMAAIEEEELRRALQQSLNENPIPQNIEEKKEEPKKEEPKKEEPKKEEPKKVFLGSISSPINIEYAGQKPKEEIKPEKKQEEKIIPQQKYQLQSSTSIVIDSKPNPYSNLEQVKKSNPYSNKTKKESPKKEKEEPKEEIKPKEETKPKEEIKTKEEPKEEEKKVDSKPKQEERIGRDFINVFEEKKRTLKPLGNKTSLLQDLQKKKTNIKENIERMNIKKENKPKIESATDIIKNQIQKDKENNNDIVNLDDDNDGLLIDEGNEEEDNNNKYVSKHIIQMGKIEIPNNFNGKIPEYTKEKQEQLKEFRELVIKQKIHDRINDEDDI